ncbi:MAG: WG repeat-containing protein [Bacteroidota bacterium]
MDELHPQKLFATRYRLIEKIGAGGFSEVWKAADEMALETEVALKIYAPDKGLDKNGIKQFRREYALTQPLENPHLLKASHFAVEADSPYLVMPLCERGSLQNLLFELGQLDEVQLARIMEQIGGGLAYLHAHDILHQDIKPDNILINRKGDYLLTDFGISVKMRGTLQKATSIARAVTLAYSPPEKYSSRPRSLPAGDIFSMGVMLYELTTGDVPWSGHGGMVLLKGAVVPDLPESFSASLNRSLKSCMHPQPGERPAATQLARLGRAFLAKGVWEDLDQIPDTPLDSSDGVVLPLVDSGPRVSSGRVTQALELEEWDLIPTSETPPENPPETKVPLSESTLSDTIREDANRLEQEQTPHLSESPEEESQVATEEPTVGSDEPEEEKKKEEKSPPLKPGRSRLRQVLLVGIPSLLLAGIGTGWWLWPMTVLKPVQEADGEWGFVNEQHQQVIPYQFSSAGAMISERSVVRLGEGVGIIDASGDWVVPPQLEEAHDFIDGRARAKVNGKYGYLNRSGRWAIPAQYYQAGDFVDGLARVEWQGKFGFLATNGEFDIPANWEFAEDFSEGLALVSIKGLFGYINRKGELQIPCEYEQAASFQDGLAPVLIDGLFGYLNLQGQLVLPARYQEASPFEEQRAIIRQDSFYVYIDSQGQIVGQESYEIAMPFHNGLARVYKRGNWGLIDTNGHLISEWYEQIDAFEGAFARVENDGRVAYLDTSGKRLTGWYDELYPFFDGRARMKHHGLFGYIDSLGEEIVGPRYSTASDFGRGIAWVQQEGLYAYLDKTGEVLSEFVYENVRFEGVSSLVPVQQNGKWDFLNIESANKLNGSWEKAEPFSGPIARVHTGQGWTFIGKDGQAVTDKEFEEAGDYLVGLEIALVRNESGQYVMTPTGEIKGPFETIQLLGKNEVLAIGKAGRLALARTNGELLSEFIFEEINPFVGGLAKARVKEGYLMLTEEGTPLHVGTFEEIGAFKDGLAWVKKDHFYGLMDDNGQEIFSPKMERVDVYNHGHAVVRENSKFSIVDRSGTVLYDKLDRVAFVSQQGLAGVAKLGKYGLLSIHHGMITNFLFQRIYPFHEGVAETRQLGVYGFLNKRGEWAIEPSFEFVGKFYKGVSIISGQEGYGIVDRNGTVLLEPRYADVGAFDRRRPFSWVEENGQYALVDLTGSIRTEWFEEIEHIGLIGFIAQQENGRALIDESGKNISAVYDEVGSYFHGRILVRKGDLYGFIDRYGKEVIPCQYTYASPFANRRAIVIVDGQSFYIDRDGNRLSDRVKPLDNQLGINYPPSD